MEHYKHLIASISTAATSLASLVFASVTKEGIAWAIGITAGLFSIYCSYLTAKKERIEIKNLKNKK